ncbi:hypothetical protein C8Q77DRAFT_1086146 [Trametes polyzona]|nr:hypothetical protein C8Q77DRAFT_1086146 [Trametes polyzona]
MASNITTVRSSCTGDDAPVHCAKRSATSEMPGEPAPSTPPRFRVAIVGGGIAGLTLAVALGHFQKQLPPDSAPLEVHIYESGPEITTVGAGISVWPRTWAVMRALGLYEDLARASVQPLENGDSKSGTVEAERSGTKGDLKPAFVFRKSDQPQEGYEFGRVMVPNGSTTMHRADMVDVLVAHLPSSCTVHTSKRLLSYTEDRTQAPKSDAGDHTQYTLHFADGTSARADVLIGGDGIKSAVRRTMYDLAHARECAPNSPGVSREECVRCGRATPQWTGTVGYRYLIPSEKMRAVNPEHHALKVTSPMSYSGREKHIITYPISHGKYLNWIGFVTIPGGEGTTYPHKWVLDVPQAEVAAHYAGWEPEVGEMLELVEKPTVWAIHVMENLPFSVSGSVALMGDAVHAMTTHFGAGGGQAIEDAYILGRLLADGRTTLKRVPDVLKIYEAVRLPFAREVVSNARKAGLMYEFHWPGLYDGTLPGGIEGERRNAWERKRLTELGEAIQEIWQWQWKERVEDQWEDVDRRYEELVREDSETLSAGSKARRRAGEARGRWGGKCEIM